MPSDAITVCQWNTARDGALDERIIRALHVPQDRYRISRSRYPGGTAFPVTTRAGTLYVLQGHCQFAGFDVLAGEFIRYPAGTYRLRAVGNDELVFVQAWPLPFAIPPSA